MSKNPTISNSEIVSFLSTTTVNATFLQTLKIKYRPFVCPFDELLQYVKSEKSVFDIGCGSGQLCALVAKFTDVKKIGGIEIDPSLIANAKKITSQFDKKAKFSFSVFDGIVIPNDIKKYDFVFMVDVYHHIPRKNRDAFMKQLYEKMKPGAKLMVKDIDGASSFVICNKIHDLVFAQEFSHEIDFKKMAELLESLGFKILEQRKKRILVYPHYFLLAQK